MILINSNTRHFSIPGSDLVFGVVADSDAERKYFQCPRYVGDNLDLAACFIRINYRNADGKTDFYLVDDMVINGDNITFSWLLSPKVTEYKGQVKFVLCAVGPDLKLKWHTTQGTGQVMDGLEPENSHVESQTADVVAQLIAMVEAQTSTVEKVGAEQVAVIKSATETHRTAAVNEIEAKRANSLNSIPADYTSMGKAVDAMEREKAPGIVCSAEGEVITLNDASDQAFRGFRIFGKSTQDGVPTPEKPVEIVSIESPTISVDEQVLSIPRTLHGIPVTSGGNYTDANGQQWICDEVDFERGVLIKRTNKYTVNGSGTENWMVSEIQSVDGATRFDASIATEPRAGKTFCLCNAYTSTESVNKYAETCWCNNGATVQNLQFRICTAYTPNVKELKSSLQANPVEFVYVLGTPIETPLSETELAAYRALHTNKPNTTILNDSGAYMSVDYTADTKLYIDKKIKEALQ